VRQSLVREPDGAAKAIFEGFHLTGPVTICHQAAKAQRNKNCPAVPEFLGLRVGAVLRCSSSPESFRGWF
jgi:hypothetical protein